MVERHAQQEERAIRPERTVQPVQSAHQEYPCKELRPVAVARQLRSPHYPAGKQAKRGLENGGLPLAPRAKLRDFPPNIVEGSDDISENTHWRPESPRHCRRAMHTG